MLIQVLKILLACITFGLGISLICLSLIFAVTGEPEGSVIGMLCGFAGLMYGIHISDTVRMD
tara:strand:- start:328 stop:513 length:186 start_codon:yes stop_codon:yes gene_type:complete